VEETGADGFEFTLSSRRAVETTTLQASFYRKAARERKRRRREVRKPSDPPAFPPDRDLGDAAFILRAAAENGLRVRLRGGLITVQSPRPYNRDGWRVLVAHHARSLVGLLRQRQARLRHERRNWRRRP
jgi:hypothetical protein